MGLETDSSPDVGPRRTKKNGNYREQLATGLFSSQFSCWERYGFDFWTRTMTRRRRAQKYTSEGRKEEFGL